MNPAHNRDISNGLKGHDVQVNDVLSMLYSIIILCVKIKRKSCWLNCGRSIDSIEEKGIAIKIFLTLTIISPIILHFQEIPQLLPAKMGTENLCMLFQLGSFKLHNPSRPDKFKNRRDSYPLNYPATQQKPNL